METTTTMMDAATARYQKETAKLMRYKERIQEMNANGDKFSSKRRRVATQLWKTEMRLCGMRSMAKACGLDPSAL